jgi:hypothetical protein
LLASWHRHDDRLDADFVAHSAEAKALADTKDVLIRATGTLAIDPWNDAPERNRTDVIDAVDRALALLDHPQAEASRRALPPASPRPRVRARASSRSARAACAG